MCWYKNAGVAGYAEALRPVQSDSQTSEWYSYFENDVLVIYPAAKECMNNCTFGERDSIMLLFTHRYPETYKPKFYCRRQSGMNFGYVTVNGVNSNVGFFHNQGKEFLTLRKIIVCYILIFWQY